MARKNAVKNLSEFKKNNLIAGTSLDVINRKKLNKNNTTGHRGVYLRKTDNKYIADIKFQGKKYFIKCLRIKYIANN